MYTYPAFFYQKHVLLLALCTFRPLETKRKHVLGVPVCLLYKLCSEVSTKIGFEEKVLLSDQINTESCTSYLLELQTTKKRHFNNPQKETYQSIFNQNTCQPRPPLKPLPHSHPAQRTTSLQLWSKVQSWDQAMPTKAARTAPGTAPRTPRMALLRPKRRWSGLSTDRPSWSQREKKEKTLGIHGFFMFFLGAPGVLKVEKQEPPLFLRGQRAWY